MATNKLELGGEKFIEGVKKKIHSVNQFVGETFIVSARNSVTRTIYERKPDRKPWELTGNLRNSIGYATKTNSRVTGSYGGGVGGKEGKDLAESGINEDSLVLVAGMNYAQAVESRGYDVISNSANAAKKQHAMLIKKALKV